MAQTWSVLQSACTPPTGTAVTSVSVTLPNPLTANSTLIAVGTEPIHSTHQFGIVGDGLGNSFGAPLTVAGAIHTGAWVWAMPTPAGDAGLSPAITATISGGSAAAGLLVLEVAGITGLSGAAQVDGNGASASGLSAGTSSPNYIDSAVGEMLLSVYADAGGATWTAPSGMTASPASVNGSANGNLAVAYSNSSGGTESAAWAMSSSVQWASILLALVWEDQPGDPIVTVTQGGTTAPGMSLGVVVLTGVTENGGASFSNQLTGAAQGTLTPAFTGSKVYWALADGASATTWTLDTSNVSAGQTGCGDFADSTDGCELSAGTYTGTVTAATGITVGASAPSATNAIAAYEIPLAGTAAVDPSTPPFKTAAAATTISTSAFLPPAGAVLVAMVSCDGSGTALETLAITDTASLTWTRRAISNTSGTTSAMAAVFTATVPAGIGALGAPGLQPPEPVRYQPGKHAGAPFLAPFQTWPPWDAGAAPAPAPALGFRAQASAAGNLVTSVALTIPATVQAGDGCFLLFQAYSGASGPATLTVPSTGSGWTQLGSTTYYAGTTAQVNSSLWYLSAAAADAGKVITCTSSVSLYMNASFAAYAAAALTGFAEASAAAGTATITAPPISPPVTATVSPGDWAVYFASMCNGASGFSSCTAAGATLRVANFGSASGCAAIADSGAPVGAGGTSIGGSGVSFTPNISCDYSAWTVALTAAPVPVVISSPLWPPASCTALFRASCY